jgi:RimJ/RimL family protein N-acetyltransferase
MFARTDRLLLRPGWLEDAPALAQAIGHEDVARQLADIPGPYTVADAEVFLAQPHDQHVPEFLIFSRTGRSPRLIGGIGLHKADDGAYALNFWIARPYWGLGFATEAASLVLSIAKAHGLGPIIALHPHDNHASAQVLRKLGFHQTGRIVEKHVPHMGLSLRCVVVQHGDSRVDAHDMADELYSDRARIAA